MGEVITTPLEDYQQLRTAEDELADLRAYDRAVDALDAGSGNTNGPMS